MVCVRPAVPWATTRTWRRVAAVSATPPVAAAQVPWQTTVKPALRSHPNCTRAHAPRTAPLAPTMRPQPWNAKVFNLFIETLFDQAGQLKQ